MTAAAQPYVPEAPAQCHIDVAAIVASAGAIGARPMPHPEDAMELQLLEAARECAAGRAQLPRRELVAVALREVERQIWWRDQAEREKEALRRELERTRREAKAQQQEAADQRRGLLRLLFELIAWAAPILGVAPSGEAVIAAVRAKGSGFLRHLDDGAAIDRASAEVARG